MNNKKKNCYIKSEDKRTSMSKPLLESSRIHNIPKKIIIIDIKSEILNNI